MGVLDDYLVDPKLSFLDRVKIQAQVLVPVLRALRAELGTDKADTIVRLALRDWSRQLFAAIGENIEGSSRRKWATLRSALDAVTASEVDFEILRQDSQALDIDVTHCRFADFFLAIGEPELGALLICATDVDITTPSEGAVTLERAQTIMRGAPRCTFRYTFAPRDDRSA